MNLGANIKKIRRQKDMTQESLAERLNVSVSAVSQWELGKTMPDISFIPTLCNLFGVTSDELLGIDIEQKRQKINEISMRANNFSFRGYNEEAREILTAGLRDFPDSFLLKQNLMCVAYWQSNDSAKYDSAQRETFLVEAIKLGEKIFEGCTDETLRQGTIQTLCFAYRNHGELDKAIKLAKTMPPVGISSEVLLSSVQCEGTVGYRNNQHALYKLFYFFECLTDHNCRLDSDEMAYTEDEMATLREKKIALFDLVFENGDFGFFNAHLSNTHGLQASYYARGKDTERTLSHLHLAAKYAIEFTKNLGAVKRTSLIFRGYGEEKSSFYAGDSENSVTALLKMMESEEFDFIRENKTFKAIAVELSPYSAAWKTE